MDNKIYGDCKRNHKICCWKLAEKRGKNLWKIENKGIERIKLYQVQKWLEFGLKQCKSVKNRAMNGIKMAIKTVKKRTKSIVLFSKIYKKLQERNVIDKIDEKGLGNQKSILVKS